MIFSSLMDFLSIALVVPLISLIQKSNIEGSQLAEILNMFNLQVDIQSIIYLLVFFIVFKGIFSILIVYLQANYIVLLQNYFRENIFLNYLYNNFEDTFKDHSSKTYRNIVTEVSEFISSYMSPFLTLISNLILFSFMTTLVFLVDYKSAIFIFTVFLISFFLLKIFLSNPLKKLGFERLEKDTEYFKVMANAFEFIKDIKFFNLQKIYVKKFLKVLYRQLRINRTRALLTHLPKVFFEILFVSIFSIFILYNYQDDKIIIIIGVYAAAALRVFPAINQVSAAYQKIKFSASTFKVIEENLERKDYIKKNDKKLDYQKNLTINNLDFKYKINKEYTLKDVSLSLSGKDKIGIFGESGSGKSTLLNLILGFLEPDEINSVKSNNISIYKDKESWRANISYVPQRVVILDQSLKSNVILSNPFMEFNQSKYKNAVEMSGLNTVIDKLENKDETLLGEDGDKISMGEKQRIGIARAIYRDSQIIIMDEMSNFLDEKNKSEIIENIHDFFSDKIIIMVSHDKEVLKYSNKIYELKDKKLNLLKI
jgi:ATP-binding cassette, subfamily B, bacterial PglK